MILHEFSTLAGIILASAGPSAGGCPAVPGPEILVTAQRQKTEIRHDLSKQDLMKMKGDTDLPYQMENLAHVETGGMMRGDIKIGYEINMDEIPGGTAETVYDSCVRYEKIHVILQLAPTIYIASDFAPESCWFHQINEHEESHIDLDQVVIDKYSQRIEDGLKLAFSTPQDFVSGPVRPQQVEDLKKSMGEAVMQMVDVMARDMARERFERQSDVDSLRGYGYIMNSCYDGDRAFKPDLNAPEPKAR